MYHFLPRKLRLNTAYFWIGAGNAYFNSTHYLDTQLRYFPSLPAEFNAPSDPITFSYPPAWVPNVDVYLIFDALPDGSMIPFPETSTIKCFYYKIKIDIIKYSNQPLSKILSFERVDVGPINLSQLSWTYAQEENAVGVWKSATIFTITPFDNFFCGHDNTWFGPGDSDQWFIEIGQGRENLGPGPDGNYQYGPPKPTNIVHGPFISLDDASSSALAIAHGAYWGSPPAFPDPNFNERPSLPAILPMGKQYANTRLGPIASAVPKEMLDGNFNTGNIGPRSGFLDSATWFKSLNISRSDDPVYPVGPNYGWNSELGAYYDLRFAPPSGDYTLESQTNTERVWRKDSQTSLTITLSEPFDFQAWKATRTPPVQCEDVGDFIISQIPLLGESTDRNGAPPYWGPLLGTTDAPWPEDSAGKIIIFNCSKFVYPHNIVVPEWEWPASVDIPFSPNFFSDTASSIDIGTAEAVLWSAANGAWTQTITFTKSERIPVGIALQNNANNWMFTWVHESGTPYKLSCWEAEIGVGTYLLAVIKYTGVLADGMTIAPDNTIVYTGNIVPDFTTQYSLDCWSHIAPPSTNQGS